MKPPLEAHARPRAPTRKTGPISRPNAVTGRLPVVEEARVGAHHVRARSSRKLIAGPAQSTSLRSIGGVSGLPCGAGAHSADGKCVGAELVALNPRRGDRHPGSFKINRYNGRWADFATGDQGGDPVSLVAYLANVSQVEAARLLARMLGLEMRRALQ